MYKCWMGGFWVLCLRRVGWRVVYEEWAGGFVIVVCRIDGYEVFVEICVYEEWVGGFIPGFMNTWFPESDRAQMSNFRRVTFTCTLDSIYDDNWLGQGWKLFNSRWLGHLWQFYKLNGVLFKKVNYVLKLLYL